MENLRRSEGPLLFASKNMRIGIPKKYRKTCGIKSKEREILLKERLNCYKMILVLREKALQPLKILIK